MQTNIPASTLPTDLAEPNSLSTTYTTNVLYPKLGPLSVNRHVRIIAGLLRDYAAATSLLGKVVDYKKIFDTPVMVIREPEAWLNEDIVFKPMLENTDVYLNTFVADLSSFRDVNPVNIENPSKALKTDQPIRSAIPSTASNLIDTLPGAGATNIGQGRFTRNPVVVVNPDSIDNQITAISDVHTADINLLNGRLVEEPVTYHRLADTSGVIRNRASEPGVIKATEKEVEKITDQQKRAYTLGNIMHGLSQVNAVIPDMIEHKIINTKGSLLKDSLLDNQMYVTEVSKVLDGIIQVDAQRLEQIGKLVDQAFKYLVNLGFENNDFINTYRRDSALRKRVKNYIIGKIDRAKPIDNMLIPLPDEADITNSREWAFQRVEHLELILGKPVLRGPFDAESVSPNSELTIAESFTSEQFELAETVTGQANQSLTDKGTFTSGRFQSALSNMTESGVSSENSFSADSTLLNTLRERRRDVIDRTLTSISSENEQRTASSSKITTSTSRSYTTRGKDPDFSTTELAFQVTTPVHAQVRLEDVNLVWAPSVPTPFLRLHTIIRDHENSSEFEYIEQNLVIDPVRPFEEYEKQTILKEMGIRGRDRYQSKSFDIPIDAKFSGDGWELDKAASSIDFRNGTGDDYNWDESWNWDDLENWSTFFKSIYQEGDRIKGEAVLETTDPEYFNKGFFTFSFVMRRLSDRSRAELRAYAAEQAAAEADRRAVYSRSRQYSKLRRDELIAHYENSLDLREEAFTALITQVFQGTPPEHYGYYKEIIRSAIDWNASTMHFEANLANGLPYPEFSRAHFMNSSAIRFILPIIRGAEDAFFEAVANNGSDYYKPAAEKVLKYTNDYRKRVEELKETNSPLLVLDDYTREVVIGRHIEAVLSKHPFSNQQ